MLFDSDKSKAQGSSVDRVPSPSRLLDSPSEVTLEYLVCGLGPSASQNISKLLELGTAFLGCESLQIVDHDDLLFSHHDSGSELLEPLGKSLHQLLIKAPAQPLDPGRLASFKNLLIQQYSRIQDVDRMWSMKKYSKALFESSPDGILVTDESGYILDVNKAMVMLTRMAREDLLGIRASKLTNAHGRTQVMKAIRYLKTNNRARFDCKIRFGSGQGVPTSISIRDFVFQGQGLLLATIRDLSYLEEEMSHCKNYEKSLSRSIANATDGFIRYDQFGRITEANPYTETLIGLSVERLKGKPVDDLLANSSLRAFRQAVAKIHDCGYASFRCHLNHSDGSEIPAQASLMQLEINGEPYCRLVLQDLRQ